MKSRKNKKSRILKPGNFFLAYFIVITLVLLWNLFHCTEYSFPTVDLFPEGDAELLTKADSAGIELKDEEPLLMRTGSEADDEDNIAKKIGKKLRLRGVALLGYENSHALKYSEESVSVQVINKETGDVVGNGTLPLKNQTPYPNDETAVYITLSEAVTSMQPKELEIRFSASGLTRNGIFITGGTAAEGEEQPFGRLYYEKKTWNPLTSILYYVLEILAGLGCMLLYGERRMPLLQSGRRENQVSFDEPVSSGNGTRRPAMEKISRQQMRQLAVPALVLFFVLAMMLYTYVHVIRKTAGACDGDLLTGGSKMQEVIALEPGMAFRQSLTAGRDGLSGIGIRLAEEDGDPVSSSKKASYENSMLEWKLLDESGTAELTSGSGQVKDLKKVSSVLGKDIQDEDLLAAAKESYLLPLESPVSESEDKGFVLEISMPEESGTQQNIYLLATADTNGQIELKAAGGAGASSFTKGTLPMELGLTGTYKCNGFIKGMFFRVCVIVLIMLAGLYYAARRFSCCGEGRRASGQTAAMYLVSALCMGMVFSFLTPVYTISDERTHIDSVYIVSNQILGIRDIPGPKRLWKRACDVDTSIANTMPVTAERYGIVHEELFGAAPKTGAGAAKETENASEGSPAGGAADVRISSGRELIPAYTRSAVENVPILCYLPGAIGFSFARLLGRNMITMIMMARWLNLLVCVWIMYLAIRRMPYGAAAMAVIGLFPKTLQQMASCSYDGMVIAGTFLFISLSLAAAFDEDVSVTDILALFLTGLYVAVCKGGAYLPVLGMALLIPAARKGKGRKIQKRWMAVSFAAVGGAVFLFLGKYIFRLLSMFGREAGTASIAAGTKTLYTMSDFIHSPIKLVRIYINTIMMRGDGLLGELVGKNLCQRWYFVYAFILLAILGILRRKSGRHGADVSGNQDRNYLHYPGRIWILLITAASISLVFLSMLLAFTTKGSAFIDGLQGRYFLPLAMLPLLAAENGLVHRDGIEDAAILYTADVLLAVTFCEILLTYLSGG